ncbi:hypothetical protein M1O50_04645 [Dehalococcoidia bacterium]|nr:hypothetical protein [Dehalococcoidia bacterium]
MSNCLYSHYSTNRTESQGKSSEERNSTPQSSAIALIIDDDELTDSELLRFTMNQVEEIWETLAEQYCLLKKINESLVRIEDVLQDISIGGDVSNVEQTLREILELMQKRYDDEARNDGDRWPPGRSPRKSKKGGSYVRIQP